DMEDIVTLVDGRKELVDEIRNSESELQEYLRDIFRKWLKDRDFLGCLAGHSTAGPANKVRTEGVKRRICEIAEVC
ncbi:MAG: hypothetical protein HQM10_27235, partial [Candidatus Riflebacteria bacterium]|nr:hypothetical protein [Candidatus Riflebacteria bacterium]